MALKPVDIPAFASSQLTLLSAELKAELAETAELTSNASSKALQRAGLAILNLTVTSQRTGLGGKTVIELGLDPAVGGSEAGLPEHGIRTGDIVGVQESISGAAKKGEKINAKEKGVNGVITKVGSMGISVALDNEDADVPPGRVWMYVEALLFCTCRAEADLYISVKLANDVTYKRYIAPMQGLSAFE
jgi:DNA polymerase alpha-associated DNA helicase A